MNTDYGIRIPSRSEIREAFGNLSRALDITGGDLPTLLLYLHNPERIAAAPPVVLQPGEFAKDLRKDVLVEQATAAFTAQEKPTIKATADKLGVHRSVARRALVTAGKWPQQQAARHE